MAYFAIFSAQIRIGLQYRAAALSGMIGQVAFGCIFIMIFEAFYASTQMPQPMTLEEAIVYIWLAQIMLGMLPVYLGSDIPALIRSGDVAFEMLRPVDLYSLWLARQVAFRATTVLLRGLPICLIAGLFFGLQPPATWAAAAAWSIATLFALLVCSAMALLFTITLMWTVSGEGISFLGMATVSLLSGMLVPMPFFPDWLQAAMRVLPFRSMYDIPFRLYLGHIPAADAFGAIGQQAFWLAALVLMGYWILAYGKNRLAVQGG